MLTCLFSSTANRAGTSCVARRTTSCTCGAHSTSSTSSPPPAATATTTMRRSRTTMLLWRRARSPLSHSICSQTGRAGAGAGNRLPWQPPHSHLRASPPWGQHLAHWSHNLPRHPVKLTLSSLSVLTSMAVLKLWEQSKDSDSLQDILGRLSPLWGDQPDSRTMAWRSKYCCIVSEVNLDSTLC